MKASVFYGGKDIRLEELPTPEPGPGEVLFRVRSAGVCGSDLHPYRASHPMEPHERGHELAGEVVALGDGVTSLSVGQRVGIEAEHLLGCGDCRFCKQGQYHICPTRGVRHGERQSSHGFSEYDVCVAENCYPLPDHMPYDTAAILDCYACGVHALNRTPVNPTDTVVVLGTGAIGFTLGQLAKSYGAGRVIMVGTRPEPLRVAIEAGAADLVVANSERDPVQAVMEITDGQGADSVFETVGGVAPTLNQAIEMSRYGGAISVLGLFPEPVIIDATIAMRKELRIEWSNSYSTWQGLSEYQTALKILADDKVNADPIITTHYPLSDINAAFEAANDKRTSGAIKVIVHS